MLKGENVKKSLTEALVQFVEKFFQENEDEKAEELGAKSTELSVEIKKAVDEEQRMAMFVVLIPNEVDLHGDVYQCLYPVQCRIIWMRYVCYLIFFHFSIPLQFFLSQFLTLHTVGIPITQCLKHRHALLILPPLYFRL